MGKQYNKVEKKRRRLRYIDRKREKAKSAASSSKPKARKSPVKKKEGAETASAAE